MAGPKGVEQAIACNCISHDVGCFLNIFQLGFQDMIEHIVNGINIFNGAISHGIFPLVFSDYQIFTRPLYRSLKGTLTRSALSRLPLIKTGVLMPRSIKV